MDQLPPCGQLHARPTTFSSALPARPRGMCPPPALVTILHRHLPLACVNRPLPDP